MAKLTQCDRVLRHLEDFGSITSLEAMTEYGIMRLASRISDLKGQGYAIVSERGSSKNRYGEPTSFSVYRLMKPKKPQKVIVRIKEVKVNA